MASPAPVEHSPSAISPGVVPARIGRYELLLPIGSGGQASVYLARLAGVGRFERTVALKVLHGHLRDEPALATAMLDEARIAALMHHPNVVPVLDAGDDPAGLYLVMEYVAGASLSALMRAWDERGERPPLPVLAKILDDLLAGLQFAHELCDERGMRLDLVHRDVTPHNVLVGVDGTTRLLDFGVAKAAGRDTRTRTGEIKGKVAYMSPEQINGRAIDRRVDVWAVGVVAWEMLAGRRMHPAGLDEIALALRILRDPPERLRAAAPDLPAAFDEAIGWALQMEPADRCPSAAELRRRLAKAAESVGGLASGQEVGDLVHRLFGDTLRQRTQRAVAVHETRQAAREEETTTTSQDALSGVTESGTLVPARRSVRARVLAVTAALGASGLAALFFVGRHAPAAATTVASMTTEPAVTLAAPAAAALTTGDAIVDASASSVASASPPATASATHPRSPPSATPARPRSGGSGAPRLIGNPYASH